MVLTLPLCRAIREFNCDIKITVIARSYTSALLENNPFVDRALYIDVFNDGIKQIFNENQFDDVFFPRPVFDEVFSAFRARIPIRIGSAYRWYSFLFNHKVYDHRKSGTLHEAEYNVRLLSSITDRDFQVRLIKPSENIADSQNVEEILKENGIETNTGYMIIHPGSKGSSRDWSPSNFGKLSDMISLRHNLKILITGIDSEENQCMEVMKYNLGAVNLCGRLTLGQMISLISRARVLVSNSTGVIHLAAASEIPVVGIYPNTSHIGERRWGPLTDKRIIVTPYKNNKDIDDVNTINADEVYSAVCEMLSKYSET